MSRDRPDSGMPSSSRNSPRSSGGSAAMSASSLAQMGSTSEPSSAAR